MNHFWPYAFRSASRIRTRNTERMNFFYHHINRSDNLFNKFFFKIKKFCKFPKPKSTETSILAENLPKIEIIRGHGWVTKNGFYKKFILPLGLSLRNRSHMRPRSPKDGVNASDFSCMSSSGDRTFSFARQISQRPFFHQRKDQWRSTLLSNFSFYRLVIIEKMLKFSLFFSKKRKLQHFQKTPKTIKISKGISMIKFQHGCVYIGMELVVKRYRRTHGAILK